MTRSADYDVVVIGSGVAGLSAALGLAPTRRVLLVTSGALTSGSTLWAQGGLAAAIGDDDSPVRHATDTMTAGADFGDATAIRLLTEAAPDGVAELLRYGAHLDRTDDGRLALTREGGHGRRRVVHAGGDASGAEVSRALAAAVRDSDIEVIEHTTARDLLTVEVGTTRAVTGAVLESADREERTVSAHAIVLATGGVGGLFSRTTNPPEVRGSGLGLALRAGASLVDLEFIQFHPTALDVETDSGQLPLITEALRGEGAVLLDDHGRSVMAGRHPLADLAPRDVVARRIDEVIAGGNAVQLDATRVPDLAERFPTVVATCRRHGIDPATVGIPVAPSQHFLCGGIRTDDSGTTDIVGLYAVGEVAATGVHGANRLASNSLIEGLVFGRRLATRLATELPPASLGGKVLGAIPSPDADSLTEVRQWLGSAAGIRRTGYDLERAAKELSLIRGGDEGLAATAIAVAAAERSESRGCHWRDDHPAASEWWRRRRVIVRLGADGVPIARTALSTRLTALGRTA